MLSLGTFIHTWLTKSCSNIGAGIYGAGTVLEILCVMGYIIDTYQKFAASAMAAIIVLRSILGCVLPLAAPALCVFVSHGVVRSKANHSIDMGDLGLPGATHCWPF
jgi:hypothetical protein